MIYFVQVTYIYFFTFFDPLIKNYFSGISRIFSVF